jgi:hypothetical protein
MTKVLVVCSIALFFATADCWAFRCGSGLITTGDTKTQVLAKIGKLLINMPANVTAVNFPNFKIPALIYQFYVRRLQSFFHGNISFVGY